MGTTRSYFDDALLVALPTELPSHYKVLLKDGGPDGTRTRDLLRDRQAF